MNRSPRAFNGFTLLELAAVTTLMVAAVTLAALRLDGLAETSRLRSAALQVQRVLDVAHSAALFSGEPRRVEYEADARVRLRRPVMTGGWWDWDAGREFAVGRGVQVEEVVGLADAKTPAIRIGPDGHYPEHALILKLHDQYAVLVCRSGRCSTPVFMDRRPLTGSLDVLLAELDALLQAEETGP